ncbi:hypothetical protein Pfo_008200 [Paulownia fortunei]|nr:hypothetical protein Pfo_008200 [Paulownia fortunei]
MRARYSGSRCKLPVTIHLFLASLFYRAKLNWAYRASGVSFRYPLPLALSRSTGLLLSRFASTPSFTSQLAEMNVEKLMKMAGSVRTGGKGTMRRKKKAVHKTTTTDDKRLQSTLKRIGVNAIPAIEEVNIFKEDVVIQFINPKVQASIAANTWVVSGTPQNKKLQDILPQIIHQLGPDNLENLKKLAEQFQKQAPAAGSGTASGATVALDDDDDEVPELVPGQTFEAAAEEGHTTLLKGSFQFCAIAYIFNVFEICHVTLFIMIHNRKLVLCFN